MNFRLIGAAVGALLVATACSSIDKFTGGTETKENQPHMLEFRPSAVNSPDQLDRPYVILVSIDGYRYDYNRLFSPPNLTAFASDGVSAAFLKPPYPSKTFPSHYSIVTGLYPEHHGIVSNEFFDPVRQQIFRLNEPTSVQDGSWYLGEPLWNLVEKNGMLTASFFWIGSEADIGKMRPNYYYNFDHDIPNSYRVEKVLKWLHLDRARRPHFITLYFNEVDSVSHLKGIDGPEIREAVMDVDAMIGKLRAGVEALKLPVNIIIVSDHGMLAVDPQKVILLDKDPKVAALMTKFLAIGRGPQMLLYLKTGGALKDVWALKDLLSEDAEHYRVLHGADLKRLHYNDSHRIGELVIDPDPGYLVGFKDEPPAAVGANHGWDADRAKEMNGIFYALGPAFRKNAEVPGFENVDVYPLIAQILGLKIEGHIDGEIGPTLRTLVRGEYDEHLVHRKKRKRPRPQH